MVIILSMNLTRVLFPRHNYHLEGTMFSRDEDEDIPHRHLPHVPRVLGQGDKRCIVHASAGTSSLVDLSFG